MSKPIHQTPPPTGVAPENLVVRAIQLKHRESKFSLFPTYIGLLGALVAYSVNREFFWPFGMFLIFALSIHDLAKWRSLEHLELLEELAAEVEKLRTTSTSSTDH